MSRLTLVTILTISLFLSPAIVRSNEPSLDLRLIRCASQLLDEDEYSMSSRDLLSISENSIKKLKDPNEQMAIALHQADIYSKYHSHASIESLLKIFKDDHEITAKEAYFRVQLIASCGEVLKARKIAPVYIEKFKDDNEFLIRFLLRILPIFTVDIYQKHVEMLKRSYTGFEILVLESLVYFHKKDFLSHSNSVDKIMEVLQVYEKTPSRFLFGRILASRLGSFLYQNPTLSHLQFISHPLMNQENEFLCIIYSYHLYYYYLSLGRNSVAYQIGIKSISQFRKARVTTPQLRILSNLSIIKKKLVFDWDTSYDDLLVYDSNNMRYSVHLVRGFREFILGEFAKALTELNNANKLQFPLVGETELSFQSASMLIAYIYASCPKQEFQNPKKSIELAKVLCEQTQWKNSRFLMLYGIALASDHRMKEADEFSEKAIRGLPPESLNKPRYEKIQALFKDQKKYIHSNDELLFDYFIE